MEKTLREDIQKLLTEKNINFLIGSGASTPFFPTLGNLEVFITEKVVSIETKYLVYALYFDKIVRKNLDLINPDFSSQVKSDVLFNYGDFINKLIIKMQLRNSRISPTRANIFTTNYDMFFEIAIDKKLKDNRHIFFNDGGNGYFTRILSSDNYHKTMSLNGVFDNYQREIPMINLIKCHGSVSWRKLDQDLIRIVADLDNLTNLSTLYQKLGITEFNKKQLETNLEKGNVAFLDDYSKKIVTRLRQFYDEYKSLLIINPEKSKFEHTVLHEYYYSMLRLLSYELEKEQTILIVFGFSFADEHIRNLVKRSLNNPYLQVYIFAYNRNAENDIKSKLGFVNTPTNITFISPEENESNIDFEVFNKIIFGGT